MTPAQQQTRENNEEERRMAQAENTVHHRVAEADAALEEMGEPTYDDLRDTVDRLQDLLDRILTAQTRLRTVDEDDTEAWADALGRMMDLRDEANCALDRGVVLDNE